MPNAAHRFSITILVCWFPQSGSIVEKVQVVLIVCDAGRLVVYMVSTPLVHALVAFVF